MWNASGMVDDVDETGGGGADLPVVDIEGVLGTPHQLLCSPSTVGVTRVRPEGG